MRQFVSAIATTSLLLCIPRFYLAYHKSGVSLWCMYEVLHINKDALDRPKMLYVVLHRLDYIMYSIWDTQSRTSMERGARWNIPSLLFRKGIPRPK